MKFTCLWGLTKARCQTPCSPAWQHWSEWEDFNWLQCFFADRIFGDGMVWAASFEYLKIVKVRSKARWSQDIKNSSCPGCLGTLNLQTRILVWKTKEKNTCHMFHFTDFAQSVDRYEASLHVFLTAVCVLCQLALFNYCFYTFSSPLSSQEKKKKKRTLWAQ